MQILDFSSKFFKVPPLLVALLLFIGGCSCSKDDVTISKEKMVEKFVHFLKKEAKERGEPQENIDEIGIFYLLQKEMLSDDPKCGGFGAVPGLVQCYKIKVRLVDFLLIEFESEAQAMNMARQTKSYIFHNWVFDDVAGEPVLEDFVQKAFNAQKVE
ncbi:MAG: hypothetical protein OEY33_01100 [Bdellovibrionales bacterium]|nr:hypothetical protein [Bdellovibrionales bacterium]